jgi:2-dehydro-3-deoxy-D-gluconate 5-dehydrogenase
MGPGPMFSLESFGLTGRHALVTGGNAGIGAAIAEGLAAAGADVAVTAHAHAPDTVLAAIARSGRRAEAITIDLATLDADGAARLADDVDKRLGGFDILVNNAGIIRRAEAAAYSQADWQAVMQVNLNAAWYFAQAAGRHMAANGRGRIVNIASILGLQGGIRVPAYAASKHALIGLTRALANEWAPRGVTVNAIAPGYVATENTRALREDPARSEALLARIPAGRFGEPEDIVGAAVFLCSDAATYVNGSVLAVDGGWLAR